MIKLPIVNDKPMWDIWMSMYQLSTISVSDEIGLFNSIKNKKIHIDVLANNLGVNNRAAEVLINVLIGLGYLIKDNQKISLSTTSQAYLLPNSPFYWGAQLEGFRSSPQHKQLLLAIKKGINQLSFGNESFTDMWENGSITPDAAYNFTRKMVTTHRVFKLQQVMVHN